MENKNHNRPRRVTEWVAFKDDPSSKPMFILNETEELVDLQISGTDQVMEAVQKTSLRPIFDSFELNGRYGMYNGYRTIVVDGKDKELPPIDPHPTYVMATIANGPVLLTAEIGNGTFSAEDENGNPIPNGVARSALRILPKAVAEGLKQKKAARIAEIRDTQPISQARWDWGSRGFTKKKKLADGKEIFDWPRVSRGDLHVHGSIGPCVILSTRSGFNNEVWAKVQALSLVDGKVEIGQELEIPVLESKKNKFGKPFLFAHFKWCDDGFRAQLEKSLVVAELLRKIRPASKPTTAKK